MRRFRFSLALEVEVEAFDDTDALEAVTDCFGAGENGDLLVTEFQVLDHEKLS